MSIYNKWKNDTQYNFNTIPQGILPMKYSMVKLESISTYHMAKMYFGDNVYSQWRKIFPQLAQAGIVDDPAQYQWLVFQPTSGEVFTLAAPWIEGNSVVPVQFRQEQIILTNTSDAEIQQVKLFLQAIGASYTSAPI